MYLMLMMYGGNAVCFGVHDVSVVIKDTEMAVELRKGGLAASSLAECSRQLSRHPPFILWQTNTMRCHLHYRHKSTAVGCRSVRHRSRHRCLFIPLCADRITRLPQHRVPRNMCSVTEACSSTRASVQEAVCMR